MDEETAYDSMLERQSNKLRGITKSDMAGYYFHLWMQTLATFLRCYVEDSETLKAPEATSLELCLHLRGRAVPLRLEAVCKASASYDFGLCL